MKRQVLIKFLTANNCVLLREGKKHSLYRIVLNGKLTAVPRHPDIQEMTGKAFASNWIFHNVKSTSSRIFHSTNMRVPEGSGIRFFNIVHKYISAVYFGFNDVSYICRLHYI